MKFPSTLAKKDLAGNCYFFMLLLFYQANIPKKALLVKERTLEAKQWYFTLCDLLTQTSADNQ